MGLSHRSSTDTLTSSGRLSKLRWPNNKSTTSLTSSSDYPPSSNTFASSSSSHKSNARSSSSQWSNHVPSSSSSRSRTTSAEFTDDGRSTSTPDTISSSRFRKFWAKGQTTGSVPRVRHQSATGSSVAQTVISDSSDRSTPETFRSTNSTMPFPTSPPARDSQDSRTGTLRPASDSLSARLSIDDRFPGQGATAAIPAATTQRARAESYHPSSTSAQAQLSAASKAAAESMKAAGQSAGAGLKKFGQGIRQRTQSGKGSALGLVGIHANGKQRRTESEEDPPPLPPKPGEKQKHRSVDAQPVESKPDPQIGMPYKVQHHCHVDVGPHGYTGLPASWAQALMDQGMGPSDLRENPEEAARIIKAKAIDAQPSSSTAGSGSTRDVMRDFVKRKMEEEQKALAILRERTALYVSQERAASLDEPKARADATSSAESPTTEMMRDESPIERRSKHARKEPDSPRTLHARPTSVASSSYSSVLNQGLPSPSWSLGFGGSKELHSPPRRSSAFPPSPTSQYSSLTADEFASKAAPLLSKPSLPDVEADDDWALGLLGAALSVSVNGGGATELLSRTDAKGVVTQPPSGRRPSSPDLSNALTAFLAEPMSPAWPTTELQDRSSLEQEPSRRSGSSSGSGNRAHVSPVTPSWPTREQAVWKGSEVASTGGSSGSGDLHRGEYRGESDESSESEQELVVSRARKSQKKAVRKAAPQVLTAKSMAEAQAVVLNLKNLAASRSTPSLGNAHASTNVAAPPMPAAVNQSYSTSPSSPARSMTRSSSTQSDLHVATPNSAHSPLTNRRPAPPRIVPPTSSRSSDGGHSQPGARRISSSSQETSAPRPPELSVASVPPRSRSTGASASTGSDPHYEVALQQRASRPSSGASVGSDPARLGNLLAARRTSGSSTGRSSILSSQLSPSSARSSPRSLAISINSRRESGGSPTTEIPRHGSIPTISRNADGFYTAPSPASSRPNSFRQQQQQQQDGDPASRLVPSPSRSPLLAASGSIDTAPRQSSPLLRSVEGNNWMQQASAGGAPDEEESLPPPLPPKDSVASPPAALLHISPATSAGTASPVSPSSPLPSPRKDALRLPKGASNGTTTKMAATPPPPPPIPAEPPLARTETVRTTASSRRSGVTRRRTNTPRRSTDARRFPVSMHSVAGLSEFSFNSDDEGEYYSSDEEDDEDMWSDTEFGDDATISTSEERSERAESRARSRASRASKSRSEKRKSLDLDDVLPPQMGSREAVPPMPPLAHLQQQKQQHGHLRTLQLAQNGTQSKVANGRKSPPPPLTEAEKIKEAALRSSSDLPKAPSTPTTPNMQKRELSLPGEVVHLQDELRAESASAAFYELTLIGEGETGEVYSAWCTPTLAANAQLRVELTATLGKRVAIKVVRMPTSQQDEARTRLAGLAKELSLWRSCRHDHVLSLYAALYESGTSPCAAAAGIGPGVWLVHELADRSLADIIALRGAGVQLTEARMALIASDLLSGLEFLHSRHIVHRDCRSDNVMLSDGVAKLADFTHAVQLAPPGKGRNGGITEKRTSVVGTAYWMAPEVVKAKPYDVRADIWSLGVIVYEMIEGDPPRVDFPPLRAITLTAKLGLPSLSDPSAASRELRHFLGWATEMDPEKRPSADMLSQSEFVWSACPRSDLVALLQETIEAEAEAEAADTEVLDETDTETDGRTSVLTDASSYSQASSLRSAVRDSWHSGSTVQG